MQDYKPNSHRFKESQQTTPAASAPEKVDKVVSGAVTVKRKGELAKVAETFFAEDFRKVKDYLIKDVFLPTVKDTMFTLIFKGAERLFYGENGHAPKSSKGPGIDYGGFFKQGKNQSVVGSSANTNWYSVDNIILEDRGDAERVLSAMKAYIENYGSITIATLYEFLDEPMPEFTSAKYGWRSLNTAGIMRTSNGGYKLDLPKAIPL